MSQSLCPSCGQAQLVDGTASRKFFPPSHPEGVEVALEKSVCGSCGAEVTTREQRARNLKALAGRKAAYGEWLTGEEVLSLRKKYGITQQQASDIFGKGKIAFSRYENEASYPDLAMTRLMRLALEDARVMKTLADRSNIELPLLQKRLTESLFSLITAASREVHVHGVPAGSTLANSVPAFVNLSRFLGQLLASRHLVSAATKKSVATNDDRFALAA